MTRKQKSLLLSACFFLGMIGGQGIGVGLSYDSNSLNPVFWIGVAVALAGAICGFCLDVALIREEKEI